LTTLAQRRARRGGCKVCGVSYYRDPTPRKFAGQLRHVCEDCQPYPIVDRYLDDYRIVVDGSFVTLSGRRDVNEIGHGGAGIVLTFKGDVVASRSCEFEASNSSDAEFQAVVRGARWIPRVVILTDSQAIVDKRLIETFNPRRELYWVRRRDRGPEWNIAHQLSQEGRYRAEATWIRRTIDPVTATGPEP